MSWIGSMSEDMQSSYKCRAGNATCMKRSVQDDVKDHTNVVEETLRAWNDPCRMIWKITQMSCRKRYVHEKIHAGWYERSHKCRAGNATCMKRSMQDDKKDHTTVVQETLRAWNDPCRMIWKITYVVQETLRAWNNPCRMKWKITTVVQETLRAWNDPCRMTWTDPLYCNRNCWHCISKQIQSNQNWKITKNCVFWDVTPCGSCKNRRFGGT
jgi:hypothetical protein